MPGPIVDPGTPAPDFRLTTEDGEDFTRADLQGRITVLAFYPFAFSSVCTDQFSAYEEVVDEWRAQGVEVFGVSTDATESQRAFRSQLGVSIPMLSDFEPKGEAARAFGAYFEPAGMTNRALVVTGPDAVVRWSWLGSSPGDLPGVNLVAEGIAAAQGA
ncbi:MAG TPA: peroxiredoxin family protein [Baekduia sp.]|nr:peroxiredoxin family protein [Baekduia sp.]